MRIPWEYHENALKIPPILPTDHTEVTQGLLWYCPEITLRLPWDSPEITLKISWEYPKTRTRLPANYPRLPKDYPEITPRLPWDYSEITLSLKSSTFTASWVERRVRGWVRGWLRDWVRGVGLEVGSEDGWEIRFLQICLKNVSKTIKLIKICFNRNTNTIERPSREGLYLPFWFYPAHRANFQSLRPTVVQKKKRAFGPLAFGRKRTKRKISHIS